MVFNEASNKKIKRFLYFLMLIAFIAFILTDVLGFFGTGYESQSVVSQRNWYFETGTASLIIIILGFFYAIIDKRGDDKYGNSASVVSLGEKPHLKFFKRFTILQITWIFLILFLIFNLVNMNYFENRTYTGVGVLELQQFTQGQSTIYSSLLVPIAENLPQVALVVMIMTTLGILARKYNWSETFFFWIVFASLFVSGGLFGLGNHFLRYSSSDIALRNVFVFWAVMGFFYAITGIFTPAWIMHLSNNLFYDLARTIPRDAIQSYMILAIIILLMGYGFVYRKRFFGDSKRVT